MFKWIFPLNALSSLHSNRAARTQAESCSFIGLRANLGAARVSKNRKGEILGRKEPQICIFTPLKSFRPCLYYTKEPNEKQLLKR